MEVARPTIKPVAQGNRPRFQATTPRPQINRSNTTRPISRSPPPFEAPAAIGSFKQSAEVFAQQLSLSPSSNTALLSRGIGLLSITQLRDLLRDYSLPTGGNKQVLVNRLIIFLETIGQSQQNILTAFSAKLKQLLSINTDEANSSPHSDADSPLSNPTVTQNIPLEQVQQLFAGSPSPLYEPTDLPMAFGPVSMQPNTNQVYNINLTQQDKNAIPLLQLASSFNQVVISKIVVQINGTFINLRGPNFHTSLKDYVDKQITIQIASIDPASQVIGIVRWMKQVPINIMIHQISMKEPLKKQPLQGNQIPSGVCPLTRKIIIRPGRGVNCQHGECFDISGFICNAMKNNSWQCPICRKLLPIEDLRIDPYYFAYASGVF
ncbi:SAP domain containing protein [Trichomonas vaginalis G3]|uniref:SAP domain containing protein n=1 Tax=Trichomonas vaginalis (strain ATCC PRA-98 / G3) TaxID=412133 RepID=A2DHD3_TRIV3|nr:SUMO transferase protein [Trichomonas vaginalis G3]EAY20206.1 SAP domain containing protein [Trichomonas vaginalis G3]KAI5507701.1 SUMO transferase protein [Trichomonas vaginalis G3]|eukprot:XP_001581192.1 SAP domain containing protein [Trichomonas vaginalis G3]